MNHTISYLLQSVERLALQLPTARLIGSVFDPQALAKMRAEQEEMKTAPADSIERLLEAADVLYYAAKAYLSGLYDEDRLTAALASLVFATGRDVPQLIVVMEAKYYSRLLHGKDHEREQEAAKMALGCLPLVEIQGSMLILPDGSDLLECWDQGETGILSLAASRLALPWLTSSWRVDGETAFPSERFDTENGDPVTKISIMPFSEL